MHNPKLGGSIWSVPDVCLLTMSQVDDILWKGGRREERGITWQQKKQGNEPRKPNSLSSKATLVVAGPVL